MKRLFKKKALVPIGIVAAGIIGMGALSSLKQPPAEKEDVDSTPMADITMLELHNIELNVKAHGLVKPKETTQLVTQVGGEVVFINPDFIKGGMVEKGDVLLRIDARDYESALLQAEAQYASAKAAFETELAQSEVAKEQWADQTNPTILALRKPQLAQAKAAVKAALAGVQNARRDLERTKVKAPYDSLVGARQVSLGSVITPGSPIGTVHNTSVAQVRLPVASEDFQFLKSPTVDTPVVLVDKKETQTLTWNAYIVRDEGLIDEQSRMRFLVAEVEKPYELDDPLLFGTYVNAEIKGKTIKNAARVPYHWVNEQRLITLKDESISFTDISIVRKEANNVIIQGDFDQPKNVVTTALEYPVEGMKVKINGRNEPMSAVVGSESAL